MTASYKRQGMLFLLVGPAGVGKNTLMKAVLAQPVGTLRQLPTATTRPMRVDEQQGREHQFVSEAEFQQLIANDALIEWQPVHEHFYGMPRETVEAAIEANEDLIADIDVLGATYLRSVYPDNVILILIVPVAEDDLVKRMRERGETEEEIATRMQRVPMEMAYAPLCDYLIVNDDAKAAAEILRGIILAENSRRTLINLRVEQNLPRHRFALAASGVPCYGDEMLYQTASPHFPTVLLAQGELPHEAALRALSNTLELDVTQVDILADETIPANGEFVPPVRIESERHEHFQQVTFVYHFRLPQQFPAPDGWAWIQREQIAERQFANGR